MSFIDLGPTFLEAAGLTPPPEMTGRSLLPVLVSSRAGWVDPARDCVLTGRERHTHARPDNLGYPARAIRTRQYLYLRNFQPDRWPMGDWYEDVDGGPTRSYVIDNKDKAAVKPFFEIAFNKRPLEELYDMQADPNCLRNLAADPAHAQVRAELWGRLEKMLREQGDPRVLGYGDISDSYPRFAKMRKYPGFREEGKYNPEYQKKAQEEMKALGIR